MKILILNPHIDAQHKISQVMKARGIALLLPANSQEAWGILKLHGASVDLVIIHREGAKGSGDPGVELLYKIKKDPAQSDLPIIFTSELWTADQCANHQRTPMGANAYLRSPFGETELLKTIDAIFEPEAASPAAAISIQVDEHPKMAPPGSGEFVLEDPSGFLNRNGTNSSICLEAPDSSQPPVAPEAPVFEIESSGRAPSAPVVLESPPEAVVENSASLPGSSIEISMPIDNSALSLQPQASKFSGEAEYDIEVPDSELSKEMPYLFSRGDSSRGIEPGAFSRAFVQPVGDAVVPGGASNSPDAETLKKYLMLREQDVGALSAQLKAARDELSTVKAQLNAERSHSEQLQFTVSDQKRKVDDFERERVLAQEGVQAELGELRFQNKVKADKAKLLETQVKEAASEIDRLKERVRSDIRKIRVRERELENKLEISKKDSEAILTSRENKITELKRKLDLLEFNMDLLQDRYGREKESSAKLREKLVKAAQVVRVADGLLDDSHVTPSAKGHPEDTQAS